MRTQRNPSAHTIRRVLTAAATVAAVTGISLLGSTAASASTVLPDNPEKSCSTGVHGAIGDEVAITGSSVADLVEKGANKAKDGRWESSATIYENQISNTIADVDRIEVGKVPKADESTVSGDKIAASVVDILEGKRWGFGFDPDKTRATIEDTVAQHCGLTVFASNYDSSDSTADSTQQDSQHSDSAETPESTDGENTDGQATRGDSGGNGGTSPPRDYSDVPAAHAPSADLSVPPDLQYPPEAALPQQAPSFDVLNGGEQNQQKSENENPTVRDAGNANAIAAPEDPGGVQIPMLIAVVAVAVATAGLVRAWVLRRLAR